MRMRGMMRSEEEGPGEVGKDPEFQLELGGPRVPLTRFIISQGNGKKINPKENHPHLRLSELRLAERVWGRITGAGRN